MNFKKFLIAALFGFSIANAKLPQGNWIQNPSDVLSDTTTKRSIAILNVHGDSISLSAASFNGESVQYSGRFTDLGSTIIVMFTRLDHYFPRRRASHISKQISMKISYRFTNGKLYINQGKGEISLIKQPSHALDQISAK